MGKVLEDKIPLAISFAFSLLLPAFVMDIDRSLSLSSFFFPFIKMGSGRKSRSATFLLSSFHFMRREAGSPPPLLLIEGRMAYGVLLKLLLPREESGRVFLPLLTTRKSYGTKEHSTKAPLLPQSSDGAPLPFFSPIKEKVD